MEFLLQQENCSWNRCFGGQGPVAPSRGQRLNQIVSSVGWVKYNINFFLLIKRLCTVIQFVGEPLTLLLGLNLSYNFEGKFILTWCAFSDDPVCITRCSSLLDRGSGQHHHEDPGALYKSSSWQWRFIWKQEVSVPAAGVSSHHYTSMWFICH